MIPTPSKGLIVAAPASGSGKTLITLALLRALKNAGIKVASAKVGPDYIDPAFHARSSGHACLNLDTWAMRKSTLARTFARLDQSGHLIIVEGVMGLFDGADSDDDQSDGSAASLARLTGWPVILVVDARAQAASAAAVVRGFADHAADVDVAGVLFNRVGSGAHGDILRRACATHLPHIPILGCLPRQESLVLPERHLGLVQAGEHDQLDSFLDRAADWVAEHTDLKRLQTLAGVRCDRADVPSMVSIEPLGHRIAIATDQAFSFYYAGLMQGWRDAGCEVLPFSPLAGEGPDQHADSIYLPGGYPELHAGRLASNGFIDRLITSAQKGVPVFGECGGFMVLGKGLIDAAGVRHKMAGLLDVETSYANGKLHLGYRQLTTLKSSPLGPANLRFRGHEFHYASIHDLGSDQPLFAALTAGGDNKGAVGVVRNNVAGSFMHLIDKVDA